MLIEFCSLKQLDSEMWGTNSINLTWSSSVLPLYGQIWKRVRGPCQDRLQYFFGTLLHWIKGCNIVSRPCALKGNVSNVMCAKTKSRCIDRLELSSFVCALIMWELCSIVHHNTRMIIKYRYVHYTYKSVTIRIPTG